MKHKRQSAAVKISVIPIADAGANSYGCKQVYGRGEDETGSWQGVGTYMGIKPQAVDYDIVVIGGGIYGCGAAQAVSANGHKTLLLEQNGIASGTSSQSTKLIHGGLRYLEQFNLKLVYEALHERETLLKIAPELVSREWFYIPVYKHSKRPAWFIAAGLLLYFLLSRGRSRFKWLKKSDWAKLVPGLNTRDLTAVLAYEDASTDDAALTRAVANSAESLGCEIREHTTLQHARFNGSHWIISLEGGETVSSRLLINATGAWLNGVAENIEPLPPKVAVQLVQGSHLLLDRACPAYIYTESLDGRVMFFRPWKGKTLAGTTETPFSGDPSRCAPTDGEMDDILSTYNHYFPEARCDASDIVDTFCGLRVLPQEEGGPFAASRETVILCDDENKPKYIAIYGGKLTTYRKESERVARYVQRAFPEVENRSTKDLKLSGN